MKAPFQDLRITGLNGELCYPVEGHTLRLYLQLSSPPPLGWAYLLSQVWNAVEYPNKRRVGIESDTLWIECPPDELRTEHLARLELAIDETCERFHAQRQQKQLAIENQRELSRQTQLKLDKLARSFEPVEEASEEEVCDLPQSRLAGVMVFFRRLFEVPA